MKVFFFSLAMMMSASAFAAQDVCKDLFVCGTYTKSATDKGKTYVTTVTITATGDKSARFQYMTSVDGGKADGWNLAVTFEDNGSFKMTETNKAGEEMNYANGICEGLICTYGMHPWIRDGQKEIVGNAGMLRFKDGKLEYALIVGNPVAYDQDLQVFTKQ